MVTNVFSTQSFSRHPYSAKASTRMNSNESSFLYKPYQTKHLTESCNHDNNHLSFVWVLRSGAPIPSTWQLLKVWQIVAAFENVADCGRFSKCGRLWQSINQSINQFNLFKIAYKVSHQINK